MSLNKHECYVMLCYVMLFKVIALGRHGLERRFYFYSYYADWKHVRDWPGVSDVWTRVIFTS